MCKNQPRMKGRSSSKREWRMRDLSITYVSILIRFRNSECEEKSWRDDWIYGFGFHVFQMNLEDFEKEKVCFDFQKESRGEYKFII